MNLKPLALPASARRRIKIDRCVISISLWICFSFDFGDYGRRQATNDGDGDGDGDSMGDGWDIMVMLGRADWWSCGLWIFFVMRAASRWFVGEEDIAARTPQIFFSSPSTSIFDCWGTSPHLHATTRRMSSECWAFIFHLDDITASPVSWCSWVRPAVIASQNLKSLGSVSSWIFSSRPIFLLVPPTTVESNTEDTIGPCPCHNK